MIRFSIEFWHAIRNICYNCKLSDSTTCLRWSTKTRRKAEASSKNSYGDCWSKIDVIRYNLSNQASGKVSTRRHKNCSLCQFQTTSPGNNCSRKGDRSFLPTWLPLWRAIFPTRIRVTTSNRAVKNVKVPDVTNAIVIKKIHIVINILILQITFKSLVSLHYFTSALL